MSAPKAEAAGLTVERREELRSKWTYLRTYADLCRGQAVVPLTSENASAVLALLDALEAAEAELDEARAAVERVRALADEWEGWADVRSTPRIDTFRDAAESIRAALDTATGEGA